MFKGKLSQERLRELLDYDSKTGSFVWKISMKNNVVKGNIAGAINKLGYRLISIDRKTYRANRLAWFYEYGYFPENGIDHRDRIKHHNWISNLREASAQCNARNTGNKKNNTSGVKGVCWHKEKVKWDARIKINGKNKHLGYYKNLYNAACARLSAEQCVGWEGCDSYSPAFQYVQKNIIKDYKNRLSTNSSGQSL